MIHNTLDPEYIRSIYISFSCAHVVFSLWLSLGVFGIRRFILVVFLVPLCNPVRERGEGGSDPPDESIQFWAETGRTQDLIVIDNIVASSCDPLYQMLQQ